MIMVTEYKLSYTANQIDEKLGKIDGICADIDFLKNYATPEMFGAIGDGVTDDTDAITLAIQTGKPVHFSGNSTYYMQGVALEDNTEIYGNGCTILFTGYQATDTSGKVCFGVVGKHDVIIDGFCLIPQNHVVADIYVTDSTSVQIKNCDLQGNSITAGVYHDGGANQGIAVINSSYVTVENCKLQNIYTQALPISNGSKHVWVSNCWFENTGRGGVYIMGGNVNINVCNNTFINCVKNFTVADGAIDVYGDTLAQNGVSNDGLRIVGNYIEGFGRDHERGMACGIRLKGSHNVICEKNTIKTDANTKISCGILVQDRNGINVDECIIRDNYIFVGECIDNHWTEGIDFAYMIRIFDAEIARNVLVTGNMLVATHKGVTGIHLRGKFENLVINDNHILVGDYLGINSQNNADMVKKNVKITNNTIEGRLFLAYCDGVYVYDNRITYTADDVPLRFVNSNDCDYGRNHIYGNGIDNVPVSVCDNVRDCGDNIFYDETGSMIESSDSSSLVRVFNTNTAIIENLYRGSLVDIKVFGDIIFDTTASIDNLKEYTVFNSNGDYCIVVDGETIIRDSVRKLALKTTALSNSNYKNENGDLYVSDYRDWKNGVDRHLLHEVILTGNEGYSEDAFPAIAFRIGGEYRGKHSGDDYNRYKTPYISNFYYGDYDNPIYSTDTGYLSMYDRSGGHGFASLDEWRAFCRDMYNAGTPLKIVYLLETPYTTPIPEEEMIAYNNANIGEGTTVSNNLEKPFRVSYLIDDEVIVAIDELIKYRVDESTTADDKMIEICTITTDGTSKSFPITNSVGQMEKLKSLLLFIKLPAGCVSSEISNWGRFSLFGNNSTIASSKLTGVGGSSDRESWFIVEVFGKNKMWRMTYTATSTSTSNSAPWYSDMFSQIEAPRYCDDVRYQYMDTIGFNDVPMEGVEIKVLGTRYKQS